MRPPKNFEFPVVRDQFLSVNKPDLIQAMLENFDVKLASDDIKILKDGTELVLQFGTHNDTIPTLTFKKMTDFMTSAQVQEIVFDDQVLKMWIKPAFELLFAEAGDETLTVVKGGINAPAGTVQVSAENKIYTLLYSREDTLHQAIKEAMSLVGKKISTKPMTKDRQVDDHRVSILRKKFGQPGKGYNDRVDFQDHPTISKIIVHV